MPASIDALLADWVQVIHNSAARELAVAWLRNVPGLPPIAQGIHILSVVAVMASAGFVNLRLLGLALPSQGLAEMKRRLAPWLWGALPVLLITGALFVVARPQRYFFNPVFGFKFLFFFLALALSAALLYPVRDGMAYWQASNTRQVVAKIIAAMSLVAWILVILAGRWIAYVDYLFPRG